MKQCWNEDLLGKTEETQRKTCSSVTLCTMSVTLSHEELILRFCCEIPVPNHLRSGVACEGSINLVVYADENGWLWMSKLFLETVEEMWEG